MSEVIAGQPDKEERNWALIAHLSAIAGMLVPFVGTILGPLVVWLLKREDSEYVADQAKEALNFNITMFLGYMICFILMIIVIGSSLLRIKNRNPSCYLLKLILCGQLFPKGLIQPLQRQFLQLFHFRL